MYVLPLPPSTELIAGSERADITIVDVMEPAMSNIGVLLRMLYGCDEQILITSAPYKPQIKIN